MVRHVPHILDADLSAPDAAGRVADVDVLLGVEVGARLTGLQQHRPVLQQHHALLGLDIFFLFHCVILLLFNYNLASVVDIHAALHGLALQSATVEGVPAVGHSLTP